MYKFKSVKQSMDDIVPLKDALDVWDSSHYDSAEAGDYSATTLINPPRIVQLRKRHSDDLEIATSSRINAFFGTAVHDEYEKLLSTKDNYELENRIKTTIQDRVITGKFDILKLNGDTCNLYDIKTTKTWKLVFDPELRDWHEQLNIYAMLLRSLGYVVESINVIVHYYDWLKNMALRDRNYPQESVIEYSLSLWPEKRVREFVESRLALHIPNETVPDESLPECSREDRWERFPNGDTIKYALLKTRESKRATRVFGSLDEAISYGQSNKGFGKESVIEVRYAERTRCEHYCEVSKHCNHFQEYIKRKSNNTLNDYIPLYP